MSREGVVYIAEVSEDEAAATNAPRFRGHWESQDPPALLESGPGWATIDLAIAWGRARADVVLVRIGIPGRYYSAGARQPPRETLPEWPPV